jgi:hypothetical protein
MLNGSAPQIRKKENVQKRKNREIFIGFILFSGSRQWAKGNEDAVVLVQFPSEEESESLGQLEVSLKQLTQNEFV